MSEEATCCICLEDVQPDVNFCKLPCGHSYHSTCILEAFQSSNTCPLCRSEVVRPRPAPRSSYVGLEFLLPPGMNPQNGFLFSATGEASSSDELAEEAYQRLRRNRQARIRRVLRNDEKLRKMKETIRRLAVSHKRLVADGDRLWRRIQDEAWKCDEMRTTRKACNSSLRRLQGLERRFERSITVKVGPPPSDPQQDPAATSTPHTIVLHGPDVAM